MGVHAQGCRRVDERRIPVIAKKIVDAFNKQINEEIASAYIYLSMAAWFEEAGYEGMARWMRVQFQEELEHAMKFFDHIVSRGARVVLEAVKKPKGDWKSPLDAFRDAYKHEQYITGKIDELVKLARAESDNAAEVFLAWFVNEQVEEEESTQKTVQLLEKVKDAPGPLVMVDRELGKRGD